MTNIHFKGILTERAEDAPFIGALVVACTCSIHCKGCFNQHLIDAPILVSSAKGIVQEVLADSFNDGLILGGLEWSEQAPEAIALITEARTAGLQVMLYTGLTEEELYKRIPKEALKGCYVKFGPYKEELATQSNECFGVHLASSNQYIVKFD